MITQTWRAREDGVLSSSLLSSFFSSLLPPFVLHFVLAGCPAVYLSSLIQVSSWVFWEERQRKQRDRERGGGMDALLYKLRFAQWGCRWSSLQKHYPPPCRSSLFILFIGLVVIITFVFVCNTCNTVWCERRMDNSYFLCFCSSNFSLSLSPAISNILSPFLVHCFPSRVCPFN